MSTETHSLHDDLAFLRALAQPGDENSQLFGEIYLSAGLVYGVQMFLHAGQALRLLPGAGGGALAIGLGPTLIFLAILTWSLWRHRRAHQRGVVSKAVAATFTAVGVANLALVAVIGAVALREKSLTTWLIYPCAVFVLQGAAWLVAYLLRRRAWHGLVAAGWFAAGIGMGLSAMDMPWFIGIAGVAFIVCMAAPGWAMLRASPKTA